MPTTLLPPLPQPPAVRRALAPAEPRDDVRTPFSPEWGNIAFLGTAHLAAAGAIVYLGFGLASWWSALLGVIWFALAGLSITGGYHRLFAHRAYAAHPLIRPPAARRPATIQAFVSPALCGLRRAPPRPDHASCRHSPPVHRLLRRQRAYPCAEFVSGAG
jgi:hypothetical protein